MVDALTGTGTSTERFSPYAVQTRTGPHVTIQAGVVHAGRFWTTTSRPSLKARSVRAHHHAAAVVRGPGDTRHLLAGRTISLDPTRPFDALADPLSPVLAAGAVLRLGRDQISQVLGYLEASSSIPSGWFPHNRVLLVTDIDRTLTLDDADVVTATGDWDRTHRPVRAGRVAPVTLPEHVLDDDFRPLLDGTHPVHLGVATPEGPVAVPARWHLDGTVSASAAALGTLHAELPGPASLVVDDSASRRPDAKRGVMFRGTGHVIDVHRGRATVMIDASRVTTWDGFHAATVDVPSPRPQPSTVR